jgi:hypothetical protein
MQGIKILSKKKDCNKIKNSANEKKKKHHAGDKQM